MTDREQQIRERAYSIWREEGEADGRHDEHWRRAEAELDGGSPGEASSGAGDDVPAASPAEAAPKRKPRKKAASA